MTKQLSVDQQLVREVVKVHAEDILSEFEPGSRITVCVRQPGEPGEYHITSNDNVDKVLEVICRWKAEGGLNG